MDQVQREGTPIGGEEGLRRRGLIASILGVLAAGLFGKVGSARAENGDPLNLGAVNEATRETRLELMSSGQNVPAFKAVGNTTAAGIMPLELPVQGNIGVFGCADKGVGLWGLSDTNIGAWGMSMTGVGVLGTTYPETSRGPGAFEPYPPAGVFGVGGSQPGGWFTSESNIANWGQSNTGVGVSGESNHVGAWFKKGKVDMLLSDLEPAALHATALGTDNSACFRAHMGVAVMAEVMDPQGVALMVMGKIQSDMVNMGMIHLGSDTAPVVCNEVTERSHVQVTLNSDVGASVQWVELMPGSGVVVHLDRRAKANGTFSYLVVDMIPAH